MQTTNYARTPTTYVYDALGRLLKQTVTIETGKTAVSKYDYDASGNIIREYKPTNAVGSAATWSKTEYTYSAIVANTWIQKPAPTISGPDTMTPPLAASPSRAPIGTPPI